ncbi:MAG: recombinase family protein [Dehalococcoidia bacterium]
MNAVGYFVEGAKRAGQKRSVGDQNRAFLEFCAKEGFEVSGTFLDTDPPEAEASGYKQMLAFLRRGAREFTVVVVDNLGTLGGDLGRAAMKLMTIEAAGVSVVSAATGRDAAKDLVDAWANASGDETPVSERVRTAMRRKAVRGEVLGRPPYGYQVGPRRRFELVPEEAVVVRYIFRLYLHEGLGIRRIAGQLNEEAILTRRGQRWSMVSIRDILRNRVYLGTYTRFGVKVPGSHAPLVTAEDFRRVQERLQANQPQAKERTMTPFLLSGLVYCTRCGNRLIGVSRKQRWTTKAGEERLATYRYYQCESRTNQNACGYNTQREADLETRVRERLSQASPQQVSRFHRAGNVDTYLLDQKTQVERQESRIRRVRRQVEEVVADAARGHISLERMKAQGAELAADQEAIEAELAAAKARLEAHQTEAERHEHLEDLRDHLSADWETMTFEARQGALREVVDRVEVDGDECRVFLRP